MKIPIVIVDDEEMDRYIARRRLERNPVFGDIIEVESGSDFLNRFFNGHPPCGGNDQPLLILMDVNMPGMTGFDTLEEMQKRINNGKGTESVVVMMFTSSNNPNDQRRASELELVKGYIVKPFSVADAKYIYQYYDSL